MDEEYKAAKEAILKVYGHPERSAEKTIEQLLGLKQEINLLVADLQGMRVAKTPDGGEAVFFVASTGKPKVKRRRG